MRNAAEMMATGDGRRVQRGRRLLFAAFVAIASRLLVLRLRALAALQAIGPMVALVVLLTASASALVAALFLPDAESAANRKAALAATPPVLPEPSSLPAPLPVPTATLPAEPQWQQVRRPIAMFHLEAAELSGSDLETQILMRGPHARRETFSWTPRAGDQKAGEGRNAVRPHVQLVVERHEQALPTVRPLFADMALRAAERGQAIEKASTTDELRTKFGPFEIADTMLSGEQGMSACIAYRRIDGFGLIIAGFYCGTAQRPADRVSLACFIDRLDLVGAGQDGALKKHFAAAERNRKPCANARQPGRKMSWLDHEAPVPPLKLSARGR